MTSIDFATAMGRDLYDNKLTGTIPAEWSTLSGLSKM